MGTSAGMGFTSTGAVEGNLVNSIPEFVNEAANFRRGQITDHTRRGAVSVRRHRKESGRRPSRGSIRQVGKRRRREEKLKTRLGLVHGGKEVMGLRSQPKLWLRYINLGVSHWFYCK
jgi:hypothetical protein